MTQSLRSHRVTPSVYRPDWARLPERIQAEELDRLTVLAAIVGIPIGLIGIEVLGFSIGGWAWAAAAGLGLMGAVYLPLPNQVLRRSMPMLLYFTLALGSFAWTPDPAQGLQVTAQYLAVLVVYFAAYRAAAVDPDLLGKLQRWAVIVLPSAAFVFLRAMGDGVSTFGWIRGGNSARPMVMSVAVLFLLATVGRSRKFSIGIGLVALLAAVGSGGRMGAAVVCLLLLLNPAMRVSWKTRLALLASGVMLFAAALQLEPVQERFFVGRTEGTFSDIVALENNFNTAGRSNNWPAILSSCGRQPILGFGTGATAGITLEATNGRTGHPHNEFIRLFCEGGIVGGILFWSFFVAAGLRGLAAYNRDRNELGSLAALTVLALLLFSLTDNATIYTSVFMAPVALILGIAEYGQDRAATSVRPW